jgi:hypothetical protein
MTNILFVTVGSNFRFRGAWSNFLDLWALPTQFLAHLSGFGFKSHKYRGSEQVQQQKVHFFASFKDMLK